MQIAGLTYGEEKCLWLRTHLSFSQGVIRLWPQTRPSACFYKVLLKHKGTCLCILYGCFHATIAEQKSCNGDPVGLKA